MAGMLLHPVTIKPLVAIWPLPTTTTSTIDNNNENIYITDTVLSGLQILIHLMPPPPQHCDRDYRHFERWWNEGTDRLNDLLKVTLLEMASHPGSLPPESVLFSTIVYHQSLGQFCHSLEVTHSSSVQLFFILSCPCWETGTEIIRKHGLCGSVLTEAIFQFSWWCGLATPRSQLFVLMWEIRKSTDYVRKKK